MYYIFALINTHRLSSLCAPSESLYVVVLVCDVCKVVVVVVMMMMMVE